MMTLKMKTNILKNRKRMKARRQNMIRRNNQTKTN
jgi:hypothetical protein